MAWTETTRAHYRRAGAGYASDLTDAEWEALAAVLPHSRLGRPARHPRRTMLNAILYLLWTGCPWRGLPREFPPRSTVQSLFYRWRDDGTWSWISIRLVRLGRVSQGRAAVPTVGVIDSSSARTGENAGPRGYDAGKKIKGRKRHIVTDTQGHLLVAQVHPADIQDCHGAVPLLTALGRRFPGLRHIFADRVYRGPQLPAALADTGPWTIEIVQRPKGVKGFQLLPRRWVVERSFAWFERSRRLAKDFEATTESAAAWLHLASIKLEIRRLARH